MEKPVRFMEKKTSTGRGRKYFEFADEMVDYLREKT